MISPEDSHNREIFEHIRAIVAQIRDLLLVIKRMFYLLLCNDIAFAIALIYLTWRT